MSGSLPPGTVLTITAQGVENGKRGTKDGFTYFGCKKRGGKVGIRYRKGEIVNDVVIKTKDKEIAQRHRGRHFQIRFCLTSNSYKVKDLGVGFGAYTRLLNPLQLRDNHLLSMGESFFIVNLLPDTAIAEPPVKAEPETKGELKMRLRMKVFAGPANGEML